MIFNNNNGVIERKLEDDILMYAEQSKLRNKDEVTSEKA